MRFGENIVGKKSKQQVYAEMLQHGLLAIRHQAADSKMHLLRCYTIADFLHNVPLNILQDDFADPDLYFLNIEVKSYVSYCEHLGIPPDTTLITLAEESRGLVPEK